MKRLLCLLLACALLLALTGCANEDAAALCRSTVQNMKGRSMSFNFRIQRGFAEGKGGYAVSGSGRATDLFGDNMRVAMPTKLVSVVKVPSTSYGGFRSNESTEEFVYETFEVYARAASIYVRGRAADFGQAAWLDELTRFEASALTVKNVSVIENGDRQEIHFEIVSGSALEQSLFSLSQTMMRTYVEGYDGVQNAKAVMVVDAAGRLETLRINFEIVNTEDDYKENMEIFLDVLNYKEVNPIAFPDYVK